jgi:hypothetical protein
MTAHRPIYKTESFPHVDKNTSNKEETEGPDIASLLLRCILQNNDKMLRKLAALYSSELPIQRRDVPVPIRYSKHNRRKRRHSLSQKKLLTEDLRGLSHAIDVTHSRFIQERGSSGHICITLQHGNAGLERTDRLIRLNTGPSWWRHRVDSKYVELRVSQEGKSGSNDAERARLA